MKDDASARRGPWLSGKRSDLIGTVFVAVLGGAATIAGLGYGVFVEGNQVGPGFMPVAIGLFILGASILEIGRILFAGDSNRSDSVMAVVEATQHDAAEQIAEVRSESELDTFGRTRRQRARAPIYIFLVLAVALVLVGLLGLVVSFALAVAFMIIVVERRPWWVGLIATGCAVVFIVVVFRVILNVPLPTGHLGLI